ncbi:hypothetical protein AGMMS49957_08630 [Synergistales bacterium]|nr:hypothetical protein AGMMS49957_08630 [Synergistales bacterium]
MRKEYVEQVFAAMAEIFPAADVRIFDDNRQLTFVREGRARDAAPKSESSHEARNILRVWEPVSREWTLYMELVSDDPARTDFSLRQMARGVIGIVEEREALVQRINLTQDNYSFLANRMFFTVTPENIAYIALSGLDLGYDLTLPRAVCVIDIKTREATDALKESVPRSVLYAISAYEGFSRQDIIAQLSSDQIVLCKKLESGVRPIRKQLYKYLSDLCKFILNRCRVSVTIGVGNPPGNIGEYGSSLAEARSALRYARIFGRDQEISFIQDYTLESEISRIPPDVLDHFLGKYCRLLDSHSHLAETVEKLILNNMEITSTARSLFIHRNTALFRLKQIKKLFGLNPLHNDSDRFTLMIIYIYYKLSKRRSEIVRLSIPSVLQIADPAINPA